jgi:potassium/hydrogen antiporter
VLLLAVVGAYFASRSGVPLLVAFLALGMLLGSDGPGGIEFNDPELARTVGIVGLVAILFEGGLTTAWRGLRPVLVTASILGTLGVVVTAAITGAAAYVVFDLSVTKSLLLGAVVGSTDAAAVFSQLRFTRLRRRLTRLLEAESGVNDPMAVALTIGLIEWVEHSDYGILDLSLLLVRQLGLGLVVGVAVGAAAAWTFARLPESIEPFAPVASVATAAVGFGLADVGHGSGFLSVYIVGLFLGNTHTPFRRSLVAFHQGLAFLAQVALFVVLGLLVFPSRLDSVVGSGLALAAVLVIAARPVAVWVSTLFQRFDNRERAFLGWAGLRGAVPIVLATFVQSADVAPGESETIFNAVFFVVLVSALIQGPTLEPLARRLGLSLPAARAARPPIDVETAPDLELLEFHVAPGDAIDGTYVRELDLPRDALVSVIVRDGNSVPPRGSTRIDAGDRLYVLTRPERRDAVQEVFVIWRGAEEARTP